jgi:hypothetical protein
VPEEFHDLDAFLTMQGQVFLHKQQFTDAEALLNSHCFPTFAKARDTLMTMWNQAQEGIAMQKKGAPLTYVEKHRARVDHPIPDNIGCQYASNVRKSFSLSPPPSFSHLLSIVLCQLLVITN